MPSLKAQKRISLFYLGQGMLATMLVALAYFGLRTMAQTPTVTVGYLVESAQRDRLRYRLETKETSTFYVGKQGTFNIVLFDQHENRVASPRDLQTTITVTTLGGPDEAKKWLASKKLQPRLATSTTSVRRITLARGQQAAQLTITYRQGEKDVSVYLLSNQPGMLYIFVESPGVIPGDTAVAVVVKPKSSLQPRISQPFDSVSAPMQIMPISWQADLANQLTLDIYPTNQPITQPSQGDQVAYFKVVLQSAIDPVLAPQNITVMLRVDDGLAQFNPDILTIREGEAISREATELRTRAGGPIRVSAASANTINNQRIVPVSRTYDFKLGPHSTRLSLQKQRENAYANGLDEIELRVEALQEERAIPPEEEGMDKRTIYFQLIGDSNGVRFENNKGEITIAKGQQTGTIKLFSNRSGSHVKVRAWSRNGLRGMIESAPEGEGIPISFSFPWFQFICALIGGLIFPLLRREDWRFVAGGAVVGGIFFGSALFGAILSDPQKIGPVSIAVTKLPTENALASLILGILGSTLLGAIFIGANRYRTANGT